MENTNKNKEPMRLIYDPQPFDSEGETKLTTFLLMYADFEKMFKDTFQDFVCIHFDMFPYDVIADEKNNTKMRLYFDPGIYFLDENNEWYKNGVNKDGDQFITAFRPASQIKPFSDSKQLNEVQKMIQNVESAKKAMQATGSNKIITQEAKDILSEFVYEPKLLNPANPKIITKRPDPKHNRWLLRVGTISAPKLLKKCYGSHSAEGHKYFYDYSVITPDPRAQQLIPPCDWKIRINRTDEERANETLTKLNMNMNLQPIGGTDKGWRMCR